MLQHEQTDPQNIPPTVPLPIPNAAEARVTPDELNAALKALEDRQNSTVAIGSVVDELRLNATPEEIWAQVEKQRAEAAAPKPQMQAVPALQNAKIGRQVRRGWRQGRGWLWVLFWCTGGFGLLTSLSHHQSPQTALPVTSAANPNQITISGEDQTETIPVQGKDVVIEGEDNNITLTGHARSVTISGEDNKVQGDAPKAFVSEGEDNTAAWTPSPQTKK